MLWSCRLYIYLYIDVCRRVRWGRGQVMLGEVTLVGKESTTSKEGLRTYDLPRSGTLV